MKYIDRILLCSILVLLTGCSNVDITNDISVEDTEDAIALKEETEQNESIVSETDVDFTTIPDYDYSGSYYLVLNDNQPYYTYEMKSDINTRIELSELDALGRCGTAFEVIGTNMLPVEERGDISEIKPSGWHQEIYGNNPVYNRSHLLAFMFSGLNDENRNLITGTQHMNQEVMELFELDVRNYVRDSGNHVVYRVTPYFKGDELVARGVEMEAWSVEDNGAGICFNVYLYNVQDGVAIDYETGYTSSSDYIQEQLGNTEEDYTSYKIDVDHQQTFVVNGSNGKFHTTDCSNAAKISAKNHQEMVSTARQMIEDGYDPAGCCIK